jgi:hypothetical protein
VCIRTACGLTHLGTTAGQRCDSSTGGAHRCARRVRTLAWSALPECEIAVLSGETHLTAYVRDEAQLYGLLHRLRDLGAELVKLSIDP